MAGVTPGRSPLTSALLAWVCRDGAPQAQAELVDHLWSAVGALVRPLPVLLAPLGVCPIGCPANPASVGTLPMCAPPRAPLAAGELSSHSVCVCVFAVCVCVYMSVCGFTTKCPSEPCVKTFYQRYACCPMAIFLAMCIVERPPGFALNPFRARISQPFLARSAVSEIMELSDGFMRNLGLGIG